MLKNPHRDVTTDTQITTTPGTPIGGAENDPNKIRDRERYDLDLLTLQRIDALIHTGSLTIYDVRRYRLAATFIAAALREMGHAVSETVTANPERSLLS